MEFIIRVSDQIQPDGSQRIEESRELVRCRNCKYYPDGKGATTWTPCREIITPPEWFCADAEKAEKM